MSKPILYIDFDGVILNTIEVVREMLRRDGCDADNWWEINRYFRRKDIWLEVFEKATIINDAINQIKKVMELGIFSEVIILTKITNVFDEERLKRDLLNQVLPGVRVITLQNGLNKALVVKAKGNVLVDDEPYNCVDWEKEDGIAISFSQFVSNLEENVINYISDVINTSAVKKLLKTGNF